MADQTHGAVDSLLGLLSSAIKDEAQLLGGVHGDVQFIKDEMDSMNGFLMHLTKTTEGEHDDQLRAWMKQVRDIAYVAEDCIELYVRDLSPPDAGVLAFLRHLPVYLWTAPSRHRIATKIRELKLRVREVGERRQRYGVSVPAAEIKPSAKPSGGQDESAKEAKRRAFRQALEEDLQAETLTEASSSSGSGRCPSFTNAIGMLLRNNKASSPSSSRMDDEERIHAVLEKCYQDGDDKNFSCMKMFLCALFLLDATASTTKLDSLEKKLQQYGLGAEEPKELVRIFCYSMLSTQQKSCLQYLTTFLEEDNISRTSVVRRWVAEGLVGKEQERTPEEVGERCFGELLFRGFVVLVGASDAGTVKSCCIEDPIREFIVRIAKSENFVSELPSHLERQRQIRKIVRKGRQQQGQEQLQDRRWRRSVVGDLCCRGSAGASDEEADSRARATPKDPMDELVDLLKKLPHMYRLNVLDLGGCKGLKKRHLKSICKVVPLKYLSLRDTDVPQLRARHLQGLRNLETLDLRDTAVPPGDMSHIFLPKLKHLLAGRSNGGAGTGTAAAAVPRRIGMMRHMETLTRVQASEDGKDLEGAANLLQLRKLGVVVHANDHTTKYLRRVITGVAGTLRSLSIWVVTNDDDRTLDISMQAPFSASQLLVVLENLDIRGQCNLPPWIKEVKALANVTLGGTDMKQGDLEALGEGRGLRCLRLLDKSCSEDGLSFRSGQFEDLKVLVVDDTNIGSIGFVEKGAAPMLEKIVWSSFHKTVDREKEGPCSGTHHLPNLKLVELTVAGHDLDTLRLTPEANHERACKAT